jgi:hypothetical protein
LRRSVVRLVSQPFGARRSQSAAPALHTKLHALTLQTADAFIREGQVIPQPPQLPGSVAVITQAPPQSVVPRPHEVTHAPAEHTCPASHARPHAPQFP